MKLSFAAFVLFEALLASASPFPKYKPASDVTLRARSPTPFRQPSPNTVSSHTVQLHRSNRRATSTRRPLGRRQYSPQGSSIFPAFGEQALTLDASVVELTAQIDLGGQLFNVIFDTGSSDLWVAGENYLCASANLTEVSRDVCNITTLYEGTYTGAVIPDEHLFVSYGSSQFAVGTVGFESVTLARLTIPNQEMSIADVVSFPGANDVSGLIGLAYPQITSAFLGNQSLAGQENHNTSARQYNNFLANVFQQQLTAPIFSLAMDRNVGGLFAIGGLPEVPAVPEFSSTPILIVDILGNGDKGDDTNFTFYTIIADDYVFGPSTNPLSRRGTSGGLKSSRNIKVPESEWTRLARPHSRRGLNGTAATNFPVIVDSGSSLTTLPAPIVEAFYSEFEVTPSAIPNGGGSFYVPCNTTAPTFGVNISGQIFFMAAEDVVVPSPSINGFCVVGIQPAPPTTKGDPSILGATWLHNVLAVFDIGASEMRFAPRLPY